MWIWSRVTQRRCEPSESAARSGHSSCHSKEGDRPVEQSPIRALYGLFVTRLQGSSQLERDIVEHRPNGCSTPARRRGPARPSAEEGVEPLDEHPDTEQCDEKACDSQPVRVQPTGQSADPGLRRLRTDDVPDQRRLDEDEHDCVEEQDERDLLGARVVPAGDLAEREDVKRTGKIDRRTDDERDPHRRVVEMVLGPRRDALVLRFLRSCLLRSFARSALPAR